MIAYLFHFPPSEIWSMSLSDMAFWQREAEKIVEAMKA
ncbi:MAG: GpE family phage tail protein [Candidatus Accumulibacter sp.]|nr:GpE family phage tail protein [Accumulibacter sp.]